MLKKMMAAAMAVGVVAAFALPATASANWKHKGVDIAQPVQLELTGTEIRFQSALGGATCQVTSTVQFTPGTTGHAESFTPHPGALPAAETANCQGTGGLAFCEIHNVTSTGLPPHATPTHPLGWTIHTVAGTTDIAITHGEIHYTTTGSFCPQERITITAGTITGTVAAHKVSTITLSGNITVDAQTTGSQQRNPHKFDGAVDTVSAQVSGILHVTSPSVGTYEI